MSVWGWFVRRACEGKCWRAGFVCFYGFVHVFCRLFVNFLFGVANRVLFVVLLVFVLVCRVGAALFSFWFLGFRESVPVLFCFSYC